MIKQQSPKRKSGAILICVLTCLLVTMSLMATSVHLSLRSRRECKMALQVLQTELLLDAGLSRARSQLRQTPGYQGEVWQPADQVFRLGAASVEIRIAAHADDPSDVSQSLPADEAGRLRVSVVARFGSSLQTVDAVQRSHTFVTQLPILSTEE